MSVISKIRDHSGVAVATVAIGLILFLVGGDILGPNSIIMGSSREKIGEINGKTVTIKEYQAQLQQLENDYQIQNNKAPGEPERQQLQEQAWNQLIFNNLERPQAEAVGLDVPDNEKIDMVQGQFVHPGIKQAFTNPQTGQFDKAQIQNYLANFSRLQPAQQAAWLSFEAKLPDDRLRSKYEALIAKTDYVTRLQAAHEYQAGFEKADIQYLFVNYAAMADSTVPVTDQELSTYLSEHQARYQVQDNRALSYVAFDVKPSAEDSAGLRKELASLQSGFASAENDTAYAQANSDQAAPVQKLGVDQLPAELSPIGAALQKGQVYGPFVQQGNYVLYKVTDVLSDSIFRSRASHILIKPSDQSDTGKASARAKAAGILAQIKAGADFGMMARIHGTDGTKEQGGDLGWFDKTRMVKPFADAVFAAPGQGLLPNLVETEFGYHIIKVTAAKTNVKYQVAQIIKNVAASDATEEAAYAAATKFKQAASDADAFDKAIPAQGLKKDSAQFVPKNAFNVNNITDARGIVTWAYNEDTKVGAISTVFELPNRYVVAKVTKTQAEGPARLEDVRDQLMAEVRKDKKAKLIAEKLGTGTLEEMQKRFGAGAVVNTTSVQLSANAAMDLGYDPEAIGAIFGTKKGATTKALRGESGVAIVKVTNITQAPAIDAKTDLAASKTQVEQANQARPQDYIIRGLKDVAKVEDDRVRFM